MVCVVAGRPTGLGTHSAHVVQHGVEALIGGMPGRIELGGQPGKSPREARRHYVKLGRIVDYGPHRARQLVDVSDCGIGRKQEPAGSVCPGSSRLVRCEPTLRFPLCGRLHLAQMIGAFS